MFDRVERLLGMEALKRLSEAHVGIVGVGSLGSSCAIMLAKAGVGHYSLVDPDRLEEHNVVRHAADLRYIDQLKVDAVADLIHYRNPHAEVNACAVDARFQPQVLLGCDLVIVAGLGSEVVTAQMGHLLHEMQKPALYGGVYEKAVGGDIFFVDTAEDSPCYGCFASSIRDANLENVARTPTDYGIPLDELKTQPGLSIHIEAVAVTLADWALRFLVNDPAILAEMPTNLVILPIERHQVKVEIAGQPLFLQPRYKYWKTIRRDPDCLFCGDSISQDLESIDEMLNK